MTFGEGNRTGEYLKEISRKGGKKKNPNKGFGSLTKKQRKENSRKAHEAKRKKET